MEKNPWFWTAAIIGLALDQITKYWVVQSFASEGDRLELWRGVFEILYKTNDGAAWGFFGGGVGWLRWLSLVVSLGLMIFAWVAPRLKLAEQLGYGFILAGAFGNGIDRFLFGYVVDFLYFRAINFPVFNLADVFINLGIVFLSIAIFYPSNHKRA